MKKLFSVHVLATCAMMVALAVVLNRFCSIHTAGWTIGISFVPVAMTAILYGPAVAAAVGGLADLVGALLFPYYGQYFFGFTVTAALMGAVYGWFLYGRKTIRLFSNILLPTLINNLLLGLCVNTAWVSILHGSRTYGGWFLYRLPEYALLIPMHILLLPVLAQLHGKCGNK